MRQQAGWAVGLLLCLSPVLSSGEPIKIAVEFEAFCGTCQDFIKHDLYDLVTKPGLLDIVDLRLYAWGNARRHLGRVYCQHGGIECWANGYMNCAIDKFSTVKAAKYLRCLVKRWGRPDEIKHNSTIDSDAKACAKEEDVSWGDLSDCHSGERWQVLQDQAEHADPSDQDYTPWILINGAHSKAGEADIVDAVCKEYDRNGGSAASRPKGCPEKGDSGKVSAADMKTLLNEAEKFLPSSAAGAADIKALTEAVKSKFKSRKPCMQTLHFEDEPPAQPHSAEKDRKLRVLAKIGGKAREMEARVTK